MSGLFSSPKPPKPAPTIDPNDVSNRKGEARLRKLAGGSASTILTDAMERRSGGAVRQQLVGMGG